MKRPGRNVPTYVGAVAVAGALGALATLWFGEVATFKEIQAGLLLVAMALSGYLPLRFKFRGEVAGFTLEEAIVLTMILLLPSGLPPLLAGAGAVVGHALQRQRPMKIAFNAGQIALWATGATWTFHFLAANVGSFFSMGTLFAVGAAAVVLNLISLTAFAELFRRLEGRPWVRTVRDVWMLYVVTTIGNVSAGLLLAFTLTEDARAAGFLVVLMVGLYLGYRGYAGVLEERERNERLHDVTQTLASATGSRDALGRFLRQLAKLFSGERAELVVVLRDSARYLRVDAAGELEDRTGHDLPRILDEALHGGRAVLHSQVDADENHRDALAAPLIFEEMTIGAVAVYDRHGLEPWDANDVKLLASLANEAAVAVKNVELVVDLSEESRKLGNIVSAASDGIALVDGHGRVVTWNPAFERMTGLRSREVIGRPWGDALVVEDERSRDQLVEVMRTVMAGRSVDLPVDLHVARSSDDHRWLRCTFASVDPDDDGGDEATGVVLIARDVTREREAEELKTDFLATVSHELRTPLTPLKGFLATAESRWDELDREQLREMVSAMRRQVDRLEALIVDLLTVSEFDRGSTSMSTSEIDLTRTVEDAIGMLPVTAGARVEIDGDPSVRAVGDQRAVQRVIRALTDNALKHTNGLVTVTVARREREATVSVSDEGPGIGEWDRDRIFERFGRLGDHLTRSQGPGLGLAIAKRLAERLGGRLELESAVETGSTFVLILPTLAGVEMTAR